MAEAAPSPFGDYLARALELLAIETPRHFQRLRERLAGRAVFIAVGGESPISVAVDGRAPWVTRAAAQDGAAARVHVRARIGRADLEGLVRGDCTLEEAVLRGALEIVGTVEDVLAALDALTIWLHAALRAPSLPRLRLDYLAGAAAPPTIWHLPANRHSDEGGLS